MQEFKKDNPRKIKKVIKSHLRKSITENHFHNNSRDLKMTEVIYYLTLKIILSYYQITANKKDLFINTEKKNLKKL